MVSCHFWSSTIESTDVSVSSHFLLSSLHLLLESSHLPSTVNCDSDPHVILYNPPRHLSSGYGKISLVDEGVSSVLTGIPLRSNYNG